MGALAKTNSSITGLDSGLFAALSDKGTLAQVNSAAAKEGIFEKVVERSYEEDNEDDGAIVDAIRRGGGDATPSDMEKWEESGTAEMQSSVWGPLARVRYVCHKKVETGMGALVAV